jgi:hypothetical protein
MARQTAMMIEDKEQGSGRVELALVREREEHRRLRCHRATEPCSDLQHLRRNCLLATLRGSRELRSASDRGRSLSWLAQIAAPARLLVGRVRIALCAALLTMDILWWVGWMRAGLRGFVAMSAGRHMEGWVGYLLLFLASANAKRRIRLL